MNPLMITGNQIQTMNHFYMNPQFEERKNICWFDANQDSEINHRTATPLLSNIMLN